MEYVTLVDDHGISNPGAGWLVPGGIECLDNAFGELNSSSSLRLRQSGHLIVVRPVPQPPERIQIASGLFHGGFATVTEAIHKVLMRPISSGGR